MARRWPPREILERTITRRSWLEWIGSAAVLGLGAEVLKACTRAGSRGPEDATSGDGPADVTPEVSTDVPSDGLDLSPGDGEHDVYSSWPERTVDRQSLEEILASWSLRVDGLVEQPLSLSFPELTSLDRQDQVMDLHCVEGWSVYDIPWNGIHLSTLFDRVRPRPEATHVTFHTLGGRYNESLPIDIALEPHTILAYGVAGSTLPLGHGFPLRLVIPRLLGYKNAKYVSRVELADRPTEGYWVGAGYPYLGEVPGSRLRPGRY